MGFTLPLLLPVARCALTAPFHPYHPAKAGDGGLFSVALSLGSPPPDVIRHRGSMEPGLSSDCSAAIRPSDLGGNLGLRDDLVNPLPALLLCLRPFDLFAQGFKL